MSIFLILVTIYIIQLIVLLGPLYYKYRKSYKRRKDRTIGGFIEYTAYIMDDSFIWVAVIPFIGTVAIVVALVLLAIQYTFVLSIQYIGKYIGKGLVYLYNKFIKNIKI